MKKRARQYALLRFRPFVETGEFANVGVVMLPDYLLPGPPRFEADAAG